MGRRDPVRLVLDAGALIALEAGRRDVEMMLKRTRRAGGVVVIPAGVLGQVWRRGGRRARVARLLRWPQATVEPLDEAMAKVAGELCGLTGTSDVVDATVALAGRLHRAPVVTSDVEDLRRLDPGLRLVAC